MRMRTIDICNEAILVEQEDKTRGKIVLTNGEMKRKIVRSQERIKKTI